MRKQISSYSKRFKVGQGFLLSLRSIVGRFLCSTCRFGVGGSCLVSKQEIKIIVAAEQTMCLTRGCSFIVDASLTHTVEKMHVWPGVPGQCSQGRMRTCRLASALAMFVAFCGATGGVPSVIGLANHALVGVCLWWRRLLFGGVSSSASSSEIQGAGRSHSADVPP